MANEKNIETLINSDLTKRERRVIETKQQILDAARDLFEKRPYDDVKIDDIAEKADLGRATLYYHFDSKEAIYFEVGIQGIRSIYEQLKENINSESTGLEQTIKLGESYLRNLFEHPLDHEIMRSYLFNISKAGINPEESLKKLVEGEELDSSEKMLVSYLREVHEIEKILKAVITHGFEDGSIQDDLTAEQLVHFLHILISGIVDRVHLERIALQNVNLTVEQIITRTIELIRNDLAKK